MFVRSSKCFEIYSIKFEAEKDVNPGGYYKAIWTRDAAFILKDQFLSGHFKSTLERILLILSNQIGNEVS